MQSFGRYKRMALIAVVIVIVLMAVRVTYAHSREVAFRMVLIVKTAEGAEPKIIESEAILKSGDMFKAYLMSVEPCFMYFLLFDSKGELVTLYQPEPSDRPLLSGTLISLPSETGWYTLDDHKGEERLSFLVFSERPVEQDKLLADYASAPPTLKEHIKRNVLNKIKEIKSKQVFKTFKTPISIAGNVRGLPSGVQIDLVKALESAKEIHAQDFYSKTIIIHHQ